MILTNFASVDNLANRSFEVLKLALKIINPALATNISIIFRIDMPKITAYDYSIYGGLDGELIDISPDTITDEQGETFYRVRVRTDDRRDLAVQPAKKHAPAQHHWRRLHWIRILLLGHISPNLLPRCQVDTMQSPIIPANKHTPIHNGRGRLNRLANFVFPDHL